MYNIDEHAVYRISTRTITEPLFNVLTLTAVSAISVDIEL